MSDSQREVDNLRDPYAYIGLIAAVSKTSTHSLLASLVKFMPTSWPNGLQAFGDF